MKNNDRDAAIAELVAGIDVQKATELHDLCVQIIASLDLATLQIATLKKRNLALNRAISRKDLAFETERRSWLRAWTLERNHCDTVDKNGAISDTFDHFVAEGLEFTPGARVTRKALVAGFKAWCEFRNVKPTIGPRLIAERLRLLGAESRNIRAGGVAERGWLHVRLAVSRDV